MLKEIIFRGGARKTNFLQLKETILPPTECRSCRAGGRSTYRARS